MDKSRLANQVTLVACYTLSLTVMSMVAVFVIGFFNEKVDNTKLFEIVGPAFQTIVGGFIGLITGIKIGQSDAE